MKKKISTVRIAYKNLKRHWRFHVCTGILLLACYLLLVLGIGYVRGSGKAGVENLADMYGGWFVVSAYLPETTQSYISDELAQRIDEAMRTRFSGNYQGFERIYEDFAYIVNTTTSSMPALPESMKRNFGQGALVMTIEGLEEASLSRGGSETNSVQRTEGQRAEVQGAKTLGLRMHSNKELQDEYLQCSPKVLDTLGLKSGDVVFASRRYSMDLVVQPYPQTSSSSTWVGEISPRTAQLLFGITDNSSSQISLLFSEYPAYKAVVAALSTVAPVSDADNFDTFPVRAKIAPVSKELELFMPDVRIGLSGKILSGNNDTWNQLISNLSGLVYAQRQIYMTGGLLLIIIFFSVLVTLYISMELRSRELATYRIIGARKGKVFGMVAGEFLLLSMLVLLAGFLIQLGVGFYFSRTTFDNQQVRLLGRDGHYVIAPPIWLVPLCAVGVILIPLLGTLPSLLPMLKKSPAQALVHAEQGGE